MYNVFVIRILLTIFLAAQTCVAASMVIKPELASANRLQQMSSGEYSHATVNLDGEGKSLLIHYSSSSDIDSYILFINDDGSMNPRNILYVSLPRGEEADATVLLSESRGWTNNEMHLRLYFFTDKEFDGSISSAEIIDTGRIGGGIFQFFSKEPYSPSSYHRIVGYRLYGKSATATFIVIGLLSVIIFRNKKRVIIGLFLACIFLTSGRFALDSIRYSSDHLTEWISNGTYASAGSTYEIASYINESNIKLFRICTDGNSYFSSLLQYAAYPSVLSDDADYLVVRNSFDHSFENEILRCGGNNFSASFIKSFPDGTNLYVTSE